MSRTARFSLAICSITLGVTTSATTAQTIRYVNAAATGANNGTSWANAFRNVQSALAVAVSGNEIWVAKGTYMPDGGYIPPGGSRTPGSGDRWQSFILKNGVGVYGGFVASETQRDQRDWVANVTIFSGDLGGNDGPYFVNNGENSYHVMVSSGTSDTAVLDGFTISGGYADAYGWSERGAGLLNEGGSPTVRNCTFTANEVYVAVQIWAYAGEFVESTAVASGGAVHSLNGNPTLTNCAFVGNLVSGIAVAQADDEGAGLHTFASASIEVMGGGMFSYGGYPLITDCTFRENEAYSYCLEMLSGEYAESHAWAFSKGAGLCTRDSPTLSRCRFVDNLAHGDDHSLSGNGQFSGGGAIYCTFASAATILHSVVTGNIATSYYGPDWSAAGGGILSEDWSFSTIVNNLIVGNTSGMGGGISCTDLHWRQTIANNIVAFNSSGVYGAGLDGTPALRHNCVYGNTEYDYFGITDPTGTNGNISEDPLLVDRIGGDYHLASNSPCLDSGNNADVPAGTTTDLDGNPRIVNCVVDMGPYEADYGLPSPIAPDLDNDCDVDDEDLTIFETCGSGPGVPRSGSPICQRADFDGDNDVDQSDFAIFQRCYSGANVPQSPECGG